MKFDTENFHHLITKNELADALKFAENYIKIRSKPKYSISLLHEWCIWLLRYGIGKKYDICNFDVPMGSYMDAKICDLTNFYISFDLSSLNSLL